MESQTTPLVEEEISSVIDSIQITEPEKNGNDFIIKDLIHLLNLVITISSFIIIAYKEFNKNE